VPVDEKNGIAPIMKEMEILSKPINKICDLKRKRHEFEDEEESLDVDPELLAKKHV